MRSPRPLLVVALAAVALALSACTGGAGDDETAAAETAPAPVHSPAATATPVPDSGPVDAFRAWWTAVRSADTVAACGALTADLQQRMIAEYRASTGIEVADCGALVAQTSALYAATGMSPDVDIAIASDEGEKAVLEVTYASGDCGTAHLDHASGSWMLTELSQECGAP